MKTKSLKRYRKPAYPTRLEVLSDPDLLKRNLPPSWQIVPQMAGSVALFLAVNSTLQAADKKLGDSSRAMAVVAPIFEHGEGRGATGCVVVAPPVFLSEEEAWQVIGEELTKQGIRIAHPSFVVRGVSIPLREERYEVRNGKLESKIVDLSDKPEPYQADGADPQKRVAVEFVSEKDYHRLGGASSSSTVQSYDFKQVAQSLAERVDKQAKDKLYFGAFYDPACKFQPDPKKSTQPQSSEDTMKSWLESRIKSKAEAQRLLRLQVQDFLKWLQGQGVI